MFLLFTDYTFSRFLDLKNNFCIVVRAETLSEDQTYIGHMTGAKFGNIGEALVSSLFPTILSVSAASAGHASGGGSTEQLAATYFSALDPASVTSLYNLYRADFRMFGYSPHQYYSSDKQTS